MQGIQLNDCSYYFGNACIFHKYVSCFTMAKASETVFIIILCLRKVTDDFYMIAAICNTLNTHARISLLSW